MPNSPFDQYTEPYAKPIDTPEAIKLRKSILGPLLSGQYDDSKRMTAMGGAHSLPLADYKAGLHTLLSTNWDIKHNPNAEGQSQSLGFDPLILKYIMEQLTKPRQ